MDSLRQHLKVFHSTLGYPVVECNSFSCCMERLAE
jgi:hypothetical protein